MANENLAGKEQLITKEPTKIIDQTIKEGGIYSMLYFDMHANDPEALKNVLIGFIGNIKDSPGVKYVYGEIEEPIKGEELWSTSAEVKVLAVDFRSLLQVCASYGPIGAEIIKPDQITMRLAEAQATLLDISTLFQQVNKTLLEKVLTEDEKKEYHKKIAQRALVGKMLREKTEGKKA